LIFCSHRARKSGNSAGGQKGRGLGGRNFCPPAPKAKPRRPARSEQSPAKKFSFPFRRKRNRAPNQKMRRKLFCGMASVSERRRGGASKFAIRIFVKKSSDFNQKAPPIFRLRLLGECCRAPPKAGLGFRCDFERIFEIQKQFLPAQTEVRRAKHG